MFCRKIFLTNFLLCYFVFNLTACVTNENEDTSKTTKNFSQVKTGFLIRTTYDGYFCYGTVKLRKIENGIIDKNKAYTFYNYAAEYSTNGIYSKQTIDSLDQVYSSEFIDRIKKYNQEKIVRLFRSIEPGEYVLTSAFCRDGGRTFGMGEDMDAGIVKLFDKTGPKPLFGFNYIKIETNKLVDAGTINISPIGTISTYKGTQKGIIMSYAVPMKFQKAIQDAFPELYSHIIYKEFSSSL